jgi:cytochrome c biogenesis protein CcmG/thiol:disulfide interchange protein DsbE
VHRCLSLIAPAVACAGVAFSQAAVANKNLPAVGNAAPELSLTQVMQAPAGTKADWASLRGKVIVLEFWATWCAPCIGEIPVLNALNAAVDPAKVQIISVDDEDSAVVQAFLKKKPINGWIGLDSSSKIFDRYGVYSRPETVVVGPDGRVASTTMRPEALSAANLLALANGGPLNAAAPSAATQAQLDQSTAQAFSAQISQSATTEGALFEISLTAAGHVEEGKEPETHLMMRGPGQMDVTQASPTVLLNMALGIPATRITGAKEIDNALYNLHVEAPNAEPKQLASAVELAIASGAHLRIERQTVMKDAYVLTATPEAAGHLTHPPGGGAAFYSPKRQVLQCLNATMSQIAGGIEKALEMPVVDETGLDGMVMDTLKITPKDVASANAALATLGLKLTAAKRSIETVTVTAVPVPAVAHAGT